MLVRDRMSVPAITMDVRGSIAEAHSLMRHYSIRRVPVMQKGALVGIVTWTDLMHALPSPASTLGAWEVPGLLLRASVKEIMTATPITIGPDRPIEEAAMIMRREKIGGLPVVQDGALVGIITESDIFDAFVDLTGVRQGGARLVVDLTGHPAAEAAVAGIIERAGATLASLVIYTQDNRRLAILRADGRDPLPLAEALGAEGFPVLHLVTAPGVSNGTHGQAEPARPTWPVA
jgi:acetoin utilization protein AcuB